MPASALPPYVLILKLPDGKANGDGHAPNQQGLLCLLEEYGPTEPGPERRPDNIVLPSAGWSESERDVPDQDGLERPENELSDP